MLFWIGLIIVVGALQVKTAIRHRNYKEVAAFSVLAVGAIVLALYVQQHPAQVSLAEISLRLFHIE